MSDDLSKIKADIEELRAEQKERELALENLRGQIDRDEQQLQELDKSIKEIRRDIRELKQAVTELRDFRQAIEEMRYLQTITRRA